MVNDQFQLFYVHKVGLKYTGEYHYDFLFTKDINVVKSSGWDETICDGRPEIPKQYIDSVFTCVSEIDFNFAVDSITFNMYDVIEGIVPIIWENDSGDFENPRMYFRFGENYLTVTSKLEEKEIKVVTI